MLNPETIKSKEFQTTGRGSYRSDDVDGFLSEVTASYEQMFKENGELIKKISILANKIEEYRQDEESLKEAILSAQKFADQIVRDAKDSVRGTVEAAEEKAKAITAQAQTQADAVMADAKSQADSTILNAKKEAEEILGTVNRKVTQESLAFDMLQKEASDFRAKLISMYKEHLSLVNELPALAEEQILKAEAAQQESAPVAAEEPKKTEAITEETQAGEEAEPLSFEEAEEITEQPAQFQLAEDLEDDEPEFEDVASSSDSEEGFSLSLDDLALEDDEPEAQVSETSENIYALAEETASAPDDNGDDDDEPVSFKSFFKKK